jgi:predicted phosphodiesterase
VQTIAKVFGVSFVINAGDETEWGSDLESSFLPGDACAARSKADYLKDSDGQPLPVYQVKGNHDSTSTMEALAAEGNVTVLDGTGATATGTVLGKEVSVSLFGIGDSRYTPDDALVGKKEGDSSSLGGQAVLDARAVSRAGADIVVTHDPSAFDELSKADFTCLAGSSLLIAGHTHKEDLSQRVQDVPLLVNGTTGGGGLRTAEGGNSGQSSVMTVVYLDPATKKVERYGVVTVANDGSFSYAVTLPPASDSAER